MKHHAHFPARVLLLLGILMLLPVLACGGSDEAELIATAEPSDAIESSEVTSDVQAESSEPDAPPDAGETEETTEEAPPEDASAATGAELYNLGDVIGIGDSVLTVLGWEEVSGNDFSQPDEGKRFVAVELIIVNNSESPIGISSLIQMSLKDATAQTYDVDFMATTVIDSGGVDGELSPGESIRGKVGFQVPEEAAELQFVFDESFFGSGKVFVTLGNEPRTVEPPAELAGQLQQLTYQIGEVVSIGDSVLSILGWEDVMGDDFAQPDEGKKFIAVELVLVNQSDTTVVLSTYLQTSLKDSASQVYDVDFEASTVLDTGSVDGKLVPGEKVRGKVGFQIPSDASGLIFVFDADIFGTGKVNVALGEEPMTVEAPAEIAGERPLTYHAIGESVEMGSLTITVNEVTNPPGDGFTVPDEGKQFLVVDLTIVNRDDEANALSSLLQTSLKDAQGRVYDIDIFAPAESFPEGEVAPGETVRGQVGFQVPVDADGLVFVFDAELFGDDKLFVPLP